MLKIPPSLYHNQPNNRSHIPNISNSGSTAQTRSIFRFAPLEYYVVEKGGFFFFPSKTFERLPKKVGLRAFFSHKPPTIPPASTERSDTCLLSPCNTPQFSQAWLDVITRDLVELKCFETTQSLLFSNPLSPLSQVKICSLQLMPLDFNSSGIELQKRKLQDSKSYPNKAPTPTTRELHFRKPS